MQKIEKINVAELISRTYKHEGKTYSIDLELFGEVVKSESKWTLDTRNIFLDIKKKTKGPYWNYLNKDKKKHNFIHLAYLPCLPCHPFLPCP